MELIATNGGLDILTLAVFAILAAMVLRGPSHITTIIVTAFVAIVAWQFVKSPAAVQDAERILYGLDYEQTKRMLGSMGLIALVLALIVLRGR